MQLGGHVRWKLIKCPLDLVAHSLFSEHLSYLDFCAQTLLFHSLLRWLRFLSLLYKVMALHHLLAFLKGLVLQKHHFQNGEIQDSHTNVREHIKDFM